MFWNLFATDFLNFVFTLFPISEMCNFIDKNILISIIFTLFRVYKSDQNPYFGKMAK